MVYLYSLYMPLCVFCIYFADMPNSLLLHLVCNYLRACGCSHRC